MASIGQSPIKTGPTASTAASANTAKPGDVEADAPPVDRGFSNQNSFSRVEGDDTTQFQSKAPLLDAPKEGSGSDKAASEILKKFEQEKNISQTDGLRQSVDNLQKHPLGKQISALQNKKGDLAKQGFSQAQIEGLTSLADPTDENNSLVSMHSSSARMKGLIEGEGKEAKLFNAFEDVLVKFGAITEIPEDLQKELEADIKALTRAAFNADAPLDIDSAMTMMTEIQNKLQHERVKFDQENIKIGQVNTEHRASKIITKIRESIEKLEKAKSTQLIGKIFGYLALGIMAIATAVAVVVGAVFTGGTVSAISITLMVAATAIILTMTISSETGDWMSKIFDGLAGDDKSKVRIAANVFWTALVLVLSISSAGVGYFGAGGSISGLIGMGAQAGASASSSTGASVAATAANTVASASTFAAKAANVAAKMAKLLQFVQGVTMVAEGSAGVANSTYNYQAETLRADALEEKGEMLRLQKHIDDALESIQKVIDELQQGYSVLTSIIKAEHDTKTTLARKLGA